MGEITDIDTTHYEIDGSSYIPISQQDYFKLVEEPVSKVWHDATTKAIEGRILWHSTYNDAWMVMFADQINWNVCDKWACIDELLKL